MQQYMLDTRYRVLHWCCVYLVNLILPGFLCISALQGHAGWGVAAGVVLCRIIGLVACFRFPLLAVMLTRGGHVVAFTQVFAFGHMLVGAVAIGIAERFNIGNGRHEYDIWLDSFLSGLVAAILTGGALMTAALFLGAMIVGVQKAWTYWWMTRQAVRES